MDKDPKEISTKNQSRELILHGDLYSSVGMESNNNLVGEHRGSL